MADLSASVTPQEAARVWNSQLGPSARSVARALTQAGRPVHFTTVARWKREGLLTIASFRHPWVGVQAIGAQRTESAEAQVGSEAQFSELPAPVNPREARRVWDRQRHPSTRSVAKVLTQAGVPPSERHIWRKKYRTASGQSVN
jgi:hypothetical protein